eukprot:6198755-Amphidinium_carterae.3
MAPLSFASGFFPCLPVARLGERARCTVERFSCSTRATKACASDLPVPADSLTKASKAAKDAKESSEVAVGEGLRGGFDLAEDGHQVLGLLINKLERHPPLKSFLDDLKFGLLVDLLYKLLCLRNQLGALILQR